MHSRVFELSKNKLSMGEFASEFDLPEYFNTYSDYYGIVDKKDYAKEAKDITGREDGIMVFDKNVLSERFERKYKHFKEALDKVNEIITDGEVYSDLISPYLVYELREKVDDHGDYWVFSDNLLYTFDEFCRCVYSKMKSGDLPETVEYHIGQIWDYHY